MLGNHRIDVLMEALVLSINSSLALTTLAAIGSIIAVGFAIAQWYTDNREKKIESNLELAKKAEAYSKVEKILTEISTRQDLPLDVRQSVERANNEIRSSLSVFLRTESE